MSLELKQLKKKLQENIEWLENKKKEGIYSNHMQGLIDGYENVLEWIEGGGA